MKRIYAIFWVVAVLIIAPDARSSSESDVSFSSGEMVRGGLVLITVRAGEGDGPRVIWMNRDIALRYSRRDGLWRGFIAADLKQKPGIYRVVLPAGSSDEKRNFYLRVRQHKYGVRRLSLPGRMVDLNAKTLVRVRKEASDVRALWDGICRAPAWDGRFIMPADQKIVGGFGTESVINGRKRASHTGVDIRGRTGDPVRATHHGTVVLAVNHFFTGNSVYLDHGGCIISMYFHLDEIRVRPGETVEKGQVIGSVGATGRSTASHLHWGVRINGARVNPLTLVQLSEKLED